MRNILVLILVTVSFNCVAQDISYTQKTLTKLTSKKFWGRGYSKNGMQKAANFIQSEFKSFGLQPMDGENFKQQFTFPVNTFPGKMELKINSKKLRPGKDFIVQQASKGIQTKTRLTEKDSLNFVDTENKIILTLQDKLTWSVAQKVNDYTQVFIEKTAINTIPKSLNIKSLFKN